MRARELQSYLAAEFDRTPGEVDQRCRQLREAGLVYTGARGPWAPHVTANEAALHVLSMASRRATDALEVAHNLYFDCRVRGAVDPSESSLFGYGHLAIGHKPTYTIGQVLTNIIGGRRDPGIGNRYAIRFEIDERGRDAVAFIHRAAGQAFHHDGWMIFFSDDDRDEGKPAALFTKHAIGHRLIVSSLWLEKLGAEIVADEPSDRKSCAPGRVFPVRFSSDDV